MKIQKACLFSGKLHHFFLSFLLEHIIFTVSFLQRHKQYSFLSKRSMISLVIDQTFHTAKETHAAF